MHLFVCVCGRGVVTLGDIHCDGGGDSSSRHIHVSAVGGWRVAFEHFENDILLACYLDILWEMDQTIIKNRGQNH